MRYKSENDRCISPRFNVSRPFRLKRTPTKVCAKLSSHPLATRDAICESLPQDHAAYVITSGLPGSHTNSAVAHTNTFAKPAHLTVVALSYCNFCTIHKRVCQPLIFRQPTRHIPHNGRCACPAQSQTTRSARVTPARHIHFVRPAAMYRVRNSG